MTYKLLVFQFKSMTFVIKQLMVCGVNGVLGRNAEWHVVKVLSVENKNVFIQTPQRPENIANTMDPPLHHSRKRSATPSHVLVSSNLIKYISKISYLNTYIKILNIFKKWRACIKIFKSIYFR